MKNNKGFTLVEVIISIAALGIICAVLLRLFVVAGNTNDKAKDMQNAHLSVTSTIETLVCADSIHEGLKTLGIQTTSVLYGEFEYNANGEDLIIEIGQTQNHYPGTLYNITVTAPGNDEPLAKISTKKYEKERQYE